MMLHSDAVRHHQPDGGTRIDLDEVIHHVHLLGIFGRHDEAIEKADEALCAARELGSPLAMATANVAAARAHLAAGHTASARAFAEDAHHHIGFLDAEDERSALLMKISSCVNLTHFR